MRLVFKYIFILSVLTSCSSSTTFTDGSFYNQLEDCQQNAFNLYGNFESISLESYRSDKKSILEKGRQVFNLVDMLDQAAKADLSVILYFTAHGSQSCRVMGKQILDNADINERLQRDFLFIPLSADDRALLPEEKQIPISDDCNNYGSKRILKRVSALNVNLQIYLTKTGSQPVFYAFDSSTELGTISYVKTVGEFSGFLDKLK